MTKPEDLTTRLLGMTADELLELFKTLEAPALSEMHGEYTARLLRQPSLLAMIAGKASVSNPILPGRWLCKSFRPVDETTGRGYNTFNHLGRVVRRFPMQTLIDPSRYDGKPAYQLVYRAYESLCGDIHMVDEIRCLSRTASLGIGTWGFTKAQRRIALPFLLTGPVSAYRGDIGVERDFLLGDEVPALTRVP